MKKIYISGLLDEHDFEKSARLFEHVADLIERCGFEPIYPLKDGSGNARDNFKLLLDSYAVYFLDGWEKSKECRTEFLVALDCGIHIAMDRKDVSSLQAFSQKEDAEICPKNECEETIPSMAVDNVNHPSHYTWLKELVGIEVIDITRHMDFCLGNAAKYLLRAGRKKDASMTAKEKTIEDLRKAIWYINDKINSL